MAFWGGFLDPVGVGHGVPQPVHDDGVVVQRVAVGRHRFEFEESLGDGSIDISN